MPSEPRSPRPRIDVLGRDVDTPEAALDVAHLQARRTNRGGVDDGHHLLEVLGDQLVEDHLAAVLEGHQEDELLQVIRLAEEGLVGIAGLDLQWEDRRAQQPLQAQGLTLLPGEAGGLVEVGVIQKLAPPGIDLVVFLARHRVDLEGECPQVPTSILIRNRNASMSPIGSNNGMCTNPDHG
jgi:hypothetical protein